MNSKEREAFIKAQKEKYKAGMRVRIIHMDDPQAISGIEGTVKSVDDIGQIHVSWDNGSSLAISEEYGDEFEVIDNDDVYLVACRFSFDGERCGYITINRTYARRLEKALEYCNEKKIPISVWVNDMDKADLTTNGIISCRKITKEEAETLEKYLNFHEYVGDVVSEILQMYEDATK